MTKVKRCPFCGHKLDEENFCANEKCPDFNRKEKSDEVKDDGEQ